MPNAKMEKKGKKEPVNSNRSCDGWDVKTKDLLIGDPDDYVSARDLFNLYDKTFSSIVLTDILKYNEESEQYNTKE